MHYPGIVAGGQPCWLASTMGLVPHRPRRMAAAPAGLKDAVRPRAGLQFHCAAADCVRRREKAAVRECEGSALALAGNSAASRALRPEPRDALCKRDHSLQPCVFAAEAGTRALASEGSLTAASARPTKVEESSKPAQGAIGPPHPCRRPSAGAAAAAAVARCLTSSIHCLLNKA